MLLAFGNIGLAASFTFSGTVNGTQFGLTSSEPLTVTWSYDPTQAPSTTLGGPPAFRALYDNISATFQVGTDVVTATALIDIDNNSPSDPGDEFDLTAATFLTGTTVTGSINGISVGGVDLAIEDLSAGATMFSSLALPTDASFASSANFIQVEIDSTGNSDEILNQLSSGSYTFTSSSAPEPGTLATCFTALLALGATRIKRR